MKKWGKLWNQYLESLPKTQKKVTDFKGDIITEAKSVKPLPIEGPDGKKVSPQNPITYNTIGQDQEPRVTDNFTDGKDLSELDNIKKTVEKLERDLHTADVLKKKNKPSIEKQLKKMRKMMDEFSQKIVSSANKDLT